MATKEEMQSTLKEKYSINKNISQVLSKEDCERLIYILEHESSALKLIESFADKNSTLRSNNAVYGRMRNQAEAKLESLKAEYDALEKSNQSLQASIDNLQASNTNLEQLKQDLEQKRSNLEAEIQQITTNNQVLERKVKKLTSHNQELIGANQELKEDNKNLKNIIDAMKLKLAISTKQLLQYEDSEIRKAVVKLFKWTLG